MSSDPGNKLMCGRDIPERETGTSVQAVSMGSGGAYLPADSMRCCIATSAWEAGCRPSQHDRSRLQPTAERERSASRGAPAL